MTSELQHTLQVAGFGLPQTTIKCWHGRRVKKVEWQGCMAHIRHEVDEGVIVSWVLEKQKTGDPIIGLYIDYAKGGRQFEPGDRIRVITVKKRWWPDQHNVEIWS